MGLLTLSFHWFIESSYVAYEKRSVKTIDISGSIQAVVVISYIKAKRMKACLSKIFECCNIFWQTNVWVTFSRPLFLPVALGL